MTKARDISDLLDANGDVKSTALDNVPPSNDASALTTGTIDNARISLDANEIPSLDTAKITSGTFVDARMPSTVLNSNVDLTNLSASNLTSGTIPTARISALPSGVGGKVLQVVSTSTTSNVVTTSTSYVDINLSLNITPSATSSKIFVIYTGTNETNGTTGNRLALQMLRDATQIADSDGIGTLGSMNGIVTSASISKLDAPSTTSQITYKMQGKSNDGTVMVFNLGSSTGTLTAYEIAG